MPLREPLNSIFASLLLAAAITLALGWGDGAVQTIAIIVGLAVAFFGLRQLLLARMLDRRRGG